MSNNTMLRFGVVFSLIAILTLLTTGVPGMQGLIPQLGVSLVESHPMYESFTQQLLNEQTIQDNIDSSISYVILAISVFFGIILSVALIYFLTVTIIVNFLRKNEFSLKKFWRISIGLCIYFILFSPVAFLFLFLLRAASVSNASLFITLPLTGVLLYIYFQFAINLVFYLRTHKITKSFLLSVHLLKNKWIALHFFGAMVIYMISYIPQNSILAYISTSAFYAYLFIITDKYNR